MPLVAGATDRSHYTSGGKSGARVSCAWRYTGSKMAHF
jgi:hypothetical protein